MINCVYAKGVSETVTECRNSAKSHLHQAAQAYCYRCKWRVPVSYNAPAIVDRIPEAKQMTIDDWLK